MVVSRRLRNQQLGGSGLASAAALVEHFVAVQGQEYAPTKWGLGTRLDDVTDADIEGQLDRGEILRTHLLRPTWHFVAQKDIRWLLALTAPRVHRLNAFMCRTHGLDKTSFRACNRIIERTLAGGKEATRDEIADVLAKHRQPHSGVPLGLVMMQAELDGLVCSGARKGKANTYALIETRVPPTAAKSRDESLSELTERYLRSRGPATARDLATWSSLTLTDCRRGIAMHESKLASEDVDGGPRYWFRGQDTDTDEADVLDRLHLLPIYDEYILGYKDRTAMLAVKKQLGSPSMRFDSMIVYRGQIIGTWRRDINARSIDLAWDCFQEPTKAIRRLLDAAAVRFGEFHGLPVTLHQFDPKSTDKIHRAGWAFKNQ